MVTITIPKQLHNQRELMAVSAGDYKEFLTWQKERKQSRVISEYQPTIAEKKALVQARKNRLAGKFLTFDELKRKLGFTS